MSDSFPNGLKLGRLDGVFHPLRLADRGVIAELRPESPDRLVGVRRWRRSEDCRPVRAVVVEIDLLAGGVESDPVVRNVVRILDGLGCGVIVIAGVDRLDAAGTEGNSATSRPRSCGSIGFMEGACCCCRRPAAFWGDFLASRFEGVKKSLLLLGLVGVSSVPVDVCEGARAIVELGSGVDGGTVCCCCRDIRSSVGASAEKLDGTSVISIPSGDPKPWRPISDGLESCAFFFWFDVSSLIVETTITSGRRAKVKCPSYFIFRCHFQLNLKSVRF